MSEVQISGLAGISGGAVNFSNGMLVAGSNINTIIDLAEYYEQAEQPSGASNGAVWWDGVTMYQFIGGLWVIIDFPPPPPWYGNLAVYAGGSTLSGLSSTVYSLNIATTGNSYSNVGTLQTGGTQDTAACSDSTHAVFMGGATLSQNYLNNIQYTTFASPGNTIDFGDLIYGRFRGAAVSNGVRGVTGGGLADNSGGNKMEYITISIPGNGTDFGDLDYLTSTSGCSNATYGLFGGAYDVFDGNVIRYITIATTGNSVDFGDLTVARGKIAACSNDTRGLFAGGQNTSNIVYNVIDYVTINTPGNATDFGDLAQARYSPVGVSNGTQGVFMGGYTASNYSGLVDYVTIDTTGNAGGWGSTIVATRLFSGCSGG